MTSPDIGEHVDRNDPLGMSWRGVTATIFLLIGLVTFLVTLFWGWEQAWTPLMIGGGVYLVLAMMEAIDRSRNRRRKV